MSESGAYSAESDERSEDRRSDRQPKKRSYRLPTEDRLTRQAMYYLDRYASSEANLRQVLKRKVARAARSHDKDPADYAELIDVVVAKCLQSGVVNDTSYAETKVSGLRRRGRSSRQIFAKLRSKGVSEDVVQGALENHDADDLTAARIHARRRKIGPWRTRGSRSDYREKDMANLCRAGFSFDIARKIIDDEPDEFS